MSSFNILDPEVDIDQNLLLEASAGCGKTFTIEHLTAKLLKKGYKLNEIVITTFTKKGAEDLKERIIKNLNKEGFKVDFDDAHITTIHAFSHKLLQEDPVAAGHLYETLLSDKEIGEIVLDYMKGLDAHFSIEELEPLMPKLKKGLSNNHFPEHPEILAHFNRYFQELKDKEALFTYDDLILGLLNYVKDPKKLTALRSRFKVGIIDEFQDTDPTQWEIFSSLFLHEKGRLYIVGDPKQSIYSFRNADIYTYMEAENRFGSGAKRILSTNFRSDPSLLEQLNHLFHLGNNPSFLPLPRHGSFIPNPVVNAPEGRMDSPSFSNWEKVQFFYPVGMGMKGIFNFTAARISELHEMGISYSSIAILVDSNQLGFEAQDYLRQWNIPTVLLKEKEEEKSEALIALNKVIRAAENPKNDAILNEALQTPFFEWTLEEIKELDDLLFKEKIVWEFVKLGQAYKKSSSSFNGSLLSCRLKDESVLETILSRKDGPDWLEELEKEDIEESLALPSPKSNSCGVQILTMHKSKGLEFDVVFPIGLSALRNDKKEAFPEEIEAEKMRLLYVALTRAKRQLFIPLNLDKKKSNQRTLFDIFFSKIVPKVTLEALLKLNLPIHIASGTEAIRLPNSNTQSVVCKPPLVDLVIPLKQVLSFTKIKKIKFQLPLVEVSKDTSETYIDLPKGAETGLLLHEIFEKIPLSLCQKACSKEDYFSFVLPFIQNTSWEIWKTRIAEILFQTFNTPHDGLPFLLKDVSDKNSFREIEFLEAHSAGFMKGIIDWFFEKNGLYYIIDWKSNILSSWDDASIEALMESEDYNLQAEIYRTAAENFLSTFGHGKLAGVYYHFVRGGRLWKAL